MNRYIEHIINDLVRDTRIDYDKERIYFPFSHFPPLPPHLTPLSPLDPIPLLSIYDHSPNYFSIYCRDSFGLTKDEIDYVWNEYKKIIKEKIRNNE